MKKLIKLVLGTGLGLAAGYVAGLLLTPASGEDLQTQLRSRIDRAIDEGKSAANTREAELRAEFTTAKRGPGA